MFNTNMLLLTIVRNVLPQGIISLLRAQINKQILFSCLYALHQSYLTIAARIADCPILGGIGVHCVLHLEGALVFNVPQDGSPCTR